MTTSVIQPDASAGEAGVPEEHRLSAGGAVEVIEHASDADWDAFVATHPAACAYHYSGWPRLIGRTFGHETRMLAAYDGPAITGVLPLVVMRSRLFGRFVVSLPFLNAGGMLTGDPGAAQALVGAAVEIARKTRAEYLELRHTSRLCPQLIERRHKVAMSVQLQETVEEQWSVLDRKIRNQVRKAERSGLSVQAGGSELLRSFYDVFVRNMRDLGTPVFPFRLFEETLKTFPKSTHVFCVYKDHRPLAGAIAHVRGTWVEVIWASALREFSPLCANTLLYWHMMQAAIGAGCRTFEFGRCTPDEGPFHFKRQWGASPHPLVWEYWSRSGALTVDASPNNPRYARAVELWRRLPLPVTAALGPRIVRGIPC
jgi:FemAB-related protein (PEP-CTERM system-associated)